MLTYKTIKIIAFSIIIIASIINFIIILQMTGYYTDFLLLSLMGFNILISCFIIMLLFVIKGKTNSDNDIRWIK